MDISDTEFGEHWRIQKMNSGNSLIDQSATTPLLEQFPLLAASPNGINRLRDLIIQLALKGKLGTNNHRDEPASVLLEQILSRKRDNKKSRQAVEKDLNDSSTYSVPSNWIWTKLFNIIEDAQPGFACGERDSQGIVQLRMNNINPRGDFVWEKILRVPFDYTLKLKYELKNGDIVFNNTNSLELVGKSAVFKGFSEPIVFSNHFTRLRVIEGLIDPAYVTIWLHGQWNSKIFEKICSVEILL